MTELCSKYLPVWCIDYVFLSYHMHVYIESTIGSCLNVI